MQTKHGDHNQVDEDKNQALAREVSNNAYVMAHANDCCVGCVLTHGATFMVSGLLVGMTQEDVDGYFDHMKKNAQALVKDFVKDRGVGH